MNLERMRDSVATALSRADGGLIVRWVALVEVYDASTGDKELVQLAPDDLMHWETAGMYWAGLHDDLEGDVDD
jgi:hypothetical protein